MKLKTKAVDEYATVWILLITFVLIPHFSRANTNPKLTCSTVLKSFFFCTRFRKESSASTLSCKSRWYVLPPQKFLEWWQHEISCSFSHSNNFEWCGLTGAIFRNAENNALSSFPHFAVKLTFLLSPSSSSSESVSFSLHLGIYGSLSPEWRVMFWKCEVRAFRRLGLLKTDPCLRTFKRACRPSYCAFFSRVCWHFSLI